MAWPTSAMIRSSTSAAPAPSLAPAGSSCYAVYMTEKVVLLWMSTYDATFGDWYGLAFYYTVTWVIAAVVTNYVDLPLRPVVAKVLDLCWPPVSKAASNPPTAAPAAEPSKA